MWLSRPPSGLFLCGAILAGVITLPLLYVLFTALTTDVETWSRLWTTRIPELLVNTLLLAVGVSLGTVWLGVSLAWLLTRYRFWGSRVWEWLIILPLAIPSYVLAYIYTYLLGKGGPVDAFLQFITGTEGQIFSPFSFAGATLVMTLNTFSFVYLLARTAFRNFNLSFEEAARVTGATAWATFIRVFFPLIRPAVAAGLFLAILYVVSDFGAVSLLRYQTFTYAIYQQMESRFDYAAAA
ncbi:MAG: iron ABC transporter permease, partial [Nitrospirae bacterium]